MPVQKKNGWSATLSISDYPSTIDDPAVDEMFNWMESPVGQQSMDAYDDVPAALKTVTVDAENQQIICSDGDGLSIADSAERIHKQYNEYSVEMIGSKDCILAGNGF